MKKRILASLMCVCLLVGLLPTAALAAEDSTDEVTACTVTEGCTLEDGHEGDCVLPDEPEDTADDAADVSSGDYDVDDDTTEIVPDQEKPGEEPTAADTLAEMIAALPAPEDIDPKDEEQVEEVYHQISVIYDFAEENGIDVEDDETISTVLSALYPVETLDTTDGMSGNCGAASNKGGESSVTWALTANGGKVTVDGEEKDAYTLTISGTGAMADYSWDEKVGQTPWISYSSQITKVVIGEGVTYIGNYATYKCSNAIELNISSTVTEMGSSALNSMVNLKNITVADGNSAYSVADGVLFNADKTVLVLYPAAKEGNAYTIPDTVATIGASAFYSATIKSVTIPSSVGEIQNSAFFQSSLTSVTVPKTVTTYGDYIFSNCTSLTEAVLENPDAVWATGILRYCSALTSSGLTLPDSYTKIGTAAFQGTGLTSFEIPETVTEIGDLAFRNSALTSLVIPDDVTSCGKDIVNSCSSLKSLVVGAGLSMIPSCYNCTSLESVTVKGNPTTIAAYGFYGTKLSQFEIPNKVTKIGNNAFQGITTLTSIEIPDSVTEIQRSAFDGCTALTSVSIGSGLKTVGQSPFSNCTVLTELYIDSEVTVGSLGVGNNTSSKLTKITVGANVEVMPTSMLINQQKLATLEFEDRTKPLTIGNYSLSGLTSINSVTLPTCSITITSNAFTGDSKLAVLDMTKATSISYAAVGTGTAGSNAFTDLASSSVIYVSSSSDSTALSGKYTASKTAVAATDGGIFMEGTTFESGKLATPTKDNYIFDGWYYTPSQGQETKVETGTTLTAGTTYTAKWNRAEGGDYTVTNSLTFTGSYGEAIEGKPITATKNGETTPTIKSAISSNSSVFTVSKVAENSDAVTVTPAGNLAAGTYTGTIYVTTGDDVCHFVPVTIVVSKSGSTVTPGENSSSIKAAYGDTITLTAKVQRDATGIAMLAALDEVEFICGQTSLGTAAVTYDESGMGTATLTYNTSKGGIPVGSTAYITAQYGGSVNLNGSSGNIISVTLSPKALTVTGLTATDRPYDGTVNVALTGGTLTGIIGSDNVSTEMPTIGTMKNANAGSGKTVTVPNIILTGNDANKYTVTQPTGITVDITKATYDMSGVTFADVSYPYDGNEHELTVSGTLPTGVEVGYSDNKLTDVGSTQATATFTGDSVNYETIANKTATLTITAASSTVTITPSATTLTGGGTVKLTVSGVPEGGAVTVTQTDDQGSAAKTLELATNGEVSVSLPNTTATYTFTVSYDGDANHAGAKDACTVSVTRRSSGGGSSGGSSSSSNTTTETSKNSDGSTTTTVTDKKTGTVTETTKYKDGSTLVVETKKDGTVTTTETAANGVKVKTVDEPREDVTATVTIPRSVGTATVTVPADVTPGTVAVDAKTGEIVKLSVPTEDGLTVKLDGSADLVLLDNSKDFTDTRNHWAEDAIDFATAHEMFNGTSATTFSPDSTMTRGMIAVVLHNFEDNPDHAFTGSFDDVAHDSWYADGIHWMVDNGIAGGYGDGRFGANDKITREQLATFLYNFAKMKGYDVSGRANLGQFTDGSGVSGYATETMSWAVDSGLFGGMGDGSLAPQGDATRAQVATVLMRFVENLTK